MEKDMTKKSRLLAAMIAALALAVSLGLAGCGGSDSGSSSDDQGSTSIEQAESEESPVTIKSCKAGKDYAGKKTAVVTIQWTNDTDGKEAFYTKYSAKAYVDGEEVDRTFGTGSDEWYGDQKTIKKGKTQTFKAMFEWDGKSDIEVEVTNWLDSDDVVASKTFKM